MSGRFQLSGVGGLDLPISKKDGLDSSGTAYVSFLTKAWRVRNEKQADSKSPTAHGDWKLDGKDRPSQQRPRFAGNFKGFLWLSDGGPRADGRCSPHRVCFASATVIISGAGSSAERLTILPDHCHQMPPEQMSDGCLQTGRPRWLFTMSLIACHCVLSTKWTQDKADLGRSRNTRETWGSAAGRRRQPGKGALGPLGSLAWSPAQPRTVDPIATQMWHMTSTEGN